MGSESIFIQRLGIFHYRMPAYRAFFTVRPCDLFQL
jgi:hypothetical protein